VGGAATSPSLLFFLNKLLKGFFIFFYNFNAALTINST
jgi:hypothetical protein